MNVVKSIGFICRKFLERTDGHFSLECLHRLVRVMQWIILYVWIASPECMGCSAESAERWSSAVLWSADEGGLSPLSPIVSPSSRWIFGGSLRPLLDCPCYACYVVGRQKCGANICANYIVLWYVIICANYTVLRIACKHPDPILGSHQGELVNPSRQLLIL